MIILKYFLRFDELPHSLSTLYPTILTLRNEPFENIVGKEENAGIQHFLCFPQCFLPFYDKAVPFEPH